MLSYRSFYTCPPEEIVFKTVIYHPTLQCVPLLWNGALLQLRQSGDNVYMYLHGGKDDCPVSRNTS